MPGKSGEPPAAQLAALSVGVDIALEAFQYVIALSIAGLGREAGGMVRTSEEAEELFDLGYEAITSSTTNLWRMKF